MAHVRNAPSRGSRPIAPPQWSIDDGATLATARNTSTTVATGVPEGAVCYTSPDLLPGQSLSLNAGVLSIVSDGTVPTVNGDASGSPVDSISARDIVIEVMDSPIATIVNVTKGLTYPPGSYPSTSQGATRWANVMAQASTGDTLEVSPGSIQQVGETGNYWNGLDSCLLAIYRGVNIRGMSGRGRWTLYPNDLPLTGGASGIVVFAPAEVEDGSRYNITIEGFQFNNWGRNGDSNGIKIRQNATSTSSWSDSHASVTLRNFKIGKEPYQRSASGVAGSAEAWTIEDGHVYDTGDGVGAAPGNDHNFYISGRTLNMRGVRATRTRASNASGTSTMDGHILKLTFNTATIEGCALVCGPNGDNTDTIQMKGGGNLIVRGCLLIAGARSASGNGIIVYEKETNNFGGWTYGLAGHSLLIEKNVFINHYRYVDTSTMKTMLMFRPPGHSQEVADVSSCVVRDNVGMSTAPTSEWIKNAPESYAGGDWEDDNTALSYSAPEAGFDDRELLLYTLTGGPISGGHGSVSTYRMVWPHGYVARSDAYRGLA